MTAFPGEGLSPTDYGWCIDGNLLKVTWFEGSAIPDSLFSGDIDSTEDLAIDSDSDLHSKAENTGDLESDSDGEAWSDDSDWVEDQINNNL